MENTSNTGTYGVRRMTDFVYEISALVNNAFIFPPNKPTENVFCISTFKATK